MGPAIFEDGAFGGAIAEPGSIFTFPSGSEPWAGWANTNTDMYPLSFSQDATLTFTAAVVDGGTADVRFRFEFNPYPDIDPAYDTEVLTVTGDTPTEYTIVIESQGANTFSSFLMYLDTQDVAVQITDVVLSGVDAGSDTGTDTGTDSGTDTGSDTGITVGPAIFEDGAFEGAISEPGAIFTFPTGAQSYAGWANTNADMYPLSFSQGAILTFSAAVVDGGTADIRFRFEFEPWPNVDPAYDTEVVTVTGDTPTEYSIVIPSQGANTFSSFVMYLNTQDVAVQVTDVMLSGVDAIAGAGDGSSSGGFDALTLGATEWVLKQEVGTFGVGPTEGSVEWFSASADEFTSLSCEEPNIFVFNSDGSFFIDYQNDTWIEEWQGGSGACSSPVAPWDASIPATWSYDEANSQLTLIGQGSYLVLAKAVNGRELASPDDVPESITYNITDTSDGDITFTIDSGGIWWTFKLTSTSTGLAQ